MCGNSLEPGLPPFWGRLGSSGATALFTRFPSFSIFRWSRLPGAGAAPELAAPRSEPLLAPAELDLDMRDEVEEFWSLERGEKVDSVGW